MLKLSNVFSDFYSNIIILFVFVIFLVKICIDECKKRRIFENYKFKIEDFYKYVFVVLLFLIGILAITLLLYPIKGLVNELELVFIKFVLYLVWGFVSKKVLIKIFKKDGN